MAAPAAGLLIKPILKALKKGLATATKAQTGLSMKQISQLSNLDIVNLVRAKAIKTSKKHVANSLGITQSQLNFVIDVIKMTPARKKAVTGANYVKNVNRFLTDPVKTVKQYTKQLVERQIRKSFGGLDDVVPGEYEDVLLALKYLQGALFEKDKSLKLPDELYDNLGELDEDMIHFMTESLATDMYYQEQGHDEVLVTDVEGKDINGNPYYKGYMRGIFVKEYMEHLVSLISKGHVSIPTNGRY